MSNVSSESLFLNIPGAADRFWRKVLRPADGCWTWTAATRNGYGAIGAVRIGNTSYLAYAHRVSWHLAHGPIVGGLHVLHRCDNKRCVRPDHLFLGTHDDNMRDAAAKGLMAGWSRRKGAKRAIAQSAV